MATPAASEIPSLVDQLQEPQSVAETGLDITFIADLALKVIFFNTGVTAQAVADTLCLPFFNIVDKALTVLKREELIEVGGSNGFGELAYQYAVTIKGMNRVHDVLARSSYVGPAPVTLDEYTQVVAAQAIGDVRVGPAEVRKALADLVVDDFTLDCLGQAINTGRSLFLYGPPGNGKTVLSEHLASLLGGAIYIPYALVVDGHVIRVLDLHNHTPIASARPTGATGRIGVHDQRWVLCRRPFIIVGGELTLASLDLIYDETSHFYQAPLQVKANGGLFLIDDFGRQQMSPHALLNRWIVPLEKRVDYLTLHTGKKIEVPFDQVIVFSTNLEPKSLVDEAFLRRIQNKIRISNPSVDQFREIFRRQCISLNIAYNNDGLIYLLKEYYIKPKRDLRACHPRDLLRQMAGIARYKNIPAAITPELVDLACRTYFTDL